MNMIIICFLYGLHIIASNKTVISAFLFRCSTRCVWWELSAHSHYMLQTIICCYLFWTRLCDRVGVFDCQLDYSKSYERILVKFCWGVGSDPRTEWLDFCVSVRILLFILDHNNIED